MIKKIDLYSQKILDFLRDHIYENYTRTDIGREVGLNHPQKVIHRILQLEKKGYIRKNYDNGFYEVLDAPIKDVIYLPLYGSALCGHEGKNILNEKPEESMAVSTRMLNIFNSNDFFLVRAEGSSMEPLIKNGDIVLIKYGEKDAGQNLLVVHKGRAKIKKLVPYSDSYLLVSKNKDTKDMEVDIENDEMIIIGAVKKVICTL